MKFVLVSDEKRIFEGEVKKISCASENGPFTIMDGHVPYLSKISETVSFTKNDGGTESYEIKDGFLYTNGDVCFAIVDTPSDV
jgi:F0F1-type ATP synthase epsilon subunit